MVLQIITLDGANSWWSSTPWMFDFSTYLCTSLSTAPNSSNFKTNAHPFFFQTNLHLCLQFKDMLKFNLVHLFPVEPRRASHRKSYSLGSVSPYVPFLVFSGFPSPFPFTPLSLLPDFRPGFLSASRRSKSWAILTVVSWFNLKSLKMLRKGTIN